MGHKRVIESKHSIVWGQMAAQYDLLAPLWWENHTAMISIIILTWDKYRWSDRLQHPVIAFNIHLVHEWFSVVIWGLSRLTRLSRLEVLAPLLHHQSCSHHISTLRKCIFRFVDSCLSWTKNMKLYRKHKKERSSHFVLKTSVLLHIFTISETQWIVLSWIRL